MAVHVLGTPASAPWRLRAKRERTPLNSNPRALGGDEVGEWEWDPSDFEKADALIF